MPHSEHAMVFVVREDIPLSPGKLAVQVGHATASLLSDAYEGGDDATLEELDTWMGEGQTKLVLGVPDARLFDAVLDVLDTMDLCYRIVRDKGHTEVEPGTVTCVGIGPAKRDDLKLVTARLQLYKGATA